METISITPDFSAIKAKQQATWASGDFSQIGVRLQIVGESVCEAVDLHAGEKKDPRPISLNVSGVRRLVLIVDSLGNFGAGDHLDLGNLRLIK